MGKKGNVKMLGYFTICLGCNNNIECLYSIQYLLSTHGVWWFRGLCARLPIMRVGFQIPARAEIWIKISAPPVPPNELNFDENTDRTLSVGRGDGEEGDWPSALVYRV